MLALKKQVLRIWITEALEEEEQKQTTLARISTPLDKQAAVW
jgi:hypothetical protein